MAERRRGVRETVLALALTALGGCTSVPFDYPRDESHAEPMTADTAIGARTLEWQARHPGESAFFEISEGMDALGVRLALMESAERTIDAQYFLIKGDRAGALFAGKLLRAADRGVRVRLLLDDVFTAGLDAQLSLIDLHPNVEVRMFNPVSRQGLKAVGFLFDFQRANRRMHNKSFTVDGAATIVGGRNIAEEYFGIADEVEFADYEVIGFGEVAADVSRTFDLFWNSPQAVPIEAFGVDVSFGDLDDLRARIAELVEGAASGIYSEAVNSKLLEDIRERRVMPVPAAARVVTDEPEKLQAPPDDYAHQILVGALADRVEAAQREAIFVTPYFVPGDAGVAFFSELAARGLRVVVITNSLASTNHVAVHSGYFYRRKALLEAGVELYEMRAYVGGAPGEADRRTLHGKLVIVDRETLFVGSLNLDPRSIDLNTEMGLFIESPEIARPLAEALDEDIGPYSYRVALGADGEVEWRDESGPEPVTIREEPQAAFGRRFSLGVYQLLPIENQL